MSNFILYGIQIMLIQAFFLTAYQFFLNKETFFKWNRFYLLGTILISLAVPLIKIPVFRSSNQIVQLNEVILYNINTSRLSEVIKDQLASTSIVLYLYSIGLVFFSILFLVKLFKIWKLKNTAKVLQYDKNNIYVLSNSNQAFSFLNFIFIGENSTDFQTIFQHEVVHKERAHSLHLVVLELLKIIFWFNPILILYQNKLAEVHEFEVDATVVQKDKVKYYESIINQIFQVSNWSFTNNFFNQSLIKKRIVMLQKSKSKKRALIKYFLVVPMVVVSVLFFSNCIEKEEELPVVYKTNSSTEEELSEENKAEELAYEHFENVDEVPRFSACGEVPNEEVLDCFNEQMNLHIKKYFSYPEAAVEQNIQGRVGIQFTIDKEGNVKDIVAKGFENGTLLELEAVRIIKALPKFIPAKKAGKTVNVKYGLPITFKLM